MLWSEFRSGQTTIDGQIVAGVSFLKVAAGYPFSKDAQHRTCSTRALYPEKKTIQDHIDVEDKDANEQQKRLCVDAQSKL